MANENPDPEPNGVQADFAPNKTANTSAPRKGSVTDDVRKTSTAPSTTPAIPPLKTQSATNLARVSSPSPASSPRTSRNASPVRKDSRPAPLSGPISTQPSAAAIQRALSAANAPQLQQGAVVDAVTKLPRPPRSGENTPHWPTSPRLKSPPPSAANSRRGSSTGQKKADTPGISVQNATPQVSTPPPLKPAIDDAPKTNQLQTPPVKVPSRGVSGKSTLETVQENSADDVKEPSPAALAAAAELKPLTRLSDEENQTTKRENDAAMPSQQAAESGSESAGTRSPQKRDQNSQSQRPRNPQSKSYASLTSKSRAAEAKQGMTVETETVPSVPQSALNVGERSGTIRGENSGSIKQKASSEAIRPRKERKRTAQKARSINSSTVSSKADIFEQRVANAVDEASSSESDETFVYESNPPEPQRRARHHSRTPSVASSHSVADQQRSGIRNFGEVMDDNRRVAGKRSMKFSNHAHYDPESPEGKDGSVRSHTPRHFGRFGRGGSQQSMFDPDSPFTQASKLRSNQKSKPGSPRSPQPGQQRSSGLLMRKQESSYDFDGEVGDDERTPLMGTVRTQRPVRATARRMQRSPSIDEDCNIRRRSLCGSYSACLLGLAVLATVIFSTVVFLVMSNRPLYDVELLEIKNVLASEQELILDLWVSAVNPNALGISITDMDLDIFAKSKHVGSGGSFSKQLRDTPVIIGSTASRRRGDKQQQRKTTFEPLVGDDWQDLSKYWRSSSDGGVDHGTDPPDDDLDRDGQTMLLGRVFRFDQPLYFDGSPLKRHAHNSTGELRLAKPGNKTETGGSARWERVLQNDFELIVRGSLKYQLPISSRLQTVAIGNSIVVHPEDDVDGGGSMSVSPVDHSEHWQWVEWED